MQTCITRLQFQLGSTYGSFGSSSIKKHVTMHKIMDVLCSMKKQLPI